MRAFDDPNFFKLKHKIESTSNYKEFSLKILNNCMMEEKSNKPSWDMIKKLKLIIYFIYVSHDVLLLTKWIEFFVVSWVHIYLSQLEILGKNKRTIVMIFLNNFITFVFVFNKFLFFGGQISLIRSLNSKRKTVSFNSFINN